MGKNLLAFEAAQRQQTGDMKESPPTAGAAFHVLALTPFYPSVEDDAQGCFVAEALPAVELHRVVHTVFSVRPFYRGKMNPAKSAIPAKWRRFFALPGGLGLPSSGLFLFVRLLPEVRRLHAANPIHMIHAHSALPCGHAAFLLAQELKIPFVVTVHGLDAYSTNQVSGYAGQSCQRVSRLVYRSACRVICVSEKVCDQVANGAAAPVRTTVVYNGVDADRFAPPADDGEEGTILSVGNLIPSKGHELLIRAFCALRDRFPGVSCEMIGDGPERGHLQALSVELKISSRVRFLGRQTREQVVDAMRRCTVFALPSRYEALGCVYLEAMSSGKPVIACRGQGIEEVIQDGCNGRLIDAENLPQMTQTLATLLEDRTIRRNMGAAARQTILQKYTLAHQAAQMAGVYRECVP